MNYLSVSIASAAALLAIPGTASAEPDTYAYSKIATRNLQAAEAQLIAQRAREPSEPSVLINLAYVYKKTDRRAQAKALYEAVLAEPNVLMALGNGKPAWSHALALKGLGRSADMAGR